SASGGSSARAGGPIARAASRASIGDVRLRSMGAVLRSGGGIGAGAGSAAVARQVASQEDDEGGDRADGEDAEQFRQVSEPLAGRLDGEADGPVILEDGEVGQPVVALVLGGEDQAGDAGEGHAEAEDAGTGPGEV